MCTNVHIISTLYNMQKLDSETERFARALDYEFLIVIMHICLPTALVMCIYNVHVHIHVHDEPQLPGMNSQVHTGLHVKI